MVDARVAEVLALQAIYSSQFECDDEFSAAAAALQNGGLEGDGEASRGAALGALTCTGAIHVSDGPYNASLRFRLGPRYPSEAAACHVTSPDIPRAALDDLGAALQQQAEQAAGEAGGAECLYQLAERLREALSDLMPRGSSGADGPVGDAMAAGEAAAGDAAGGGVGGFDGVRRVLLRLDHVRNRPMYTKTVRRWTKELGLTGRMIFCRALILIVLEGSYLAVAQYLVKARTEVVDVDSAGRKCRERMMDVLEDNYCQGAAGGRGNGGNSSSDNSGNIGSGNSGNSCKARPGASAEALDDHGSGGLHGAHSLGFDEFGEVDLGSYQEVAVLLRCDEASILQYAGHARGSNDA